MDSKIDQDTESGIPRLLARSLSSEEDINTSATLLENSLAGRDVGIRIRTESL